MRFKAMALAVMVLGADSAMATDACLACQTGKLELAGEYGACRRNAESKAVRTGESPDFTKWGADMKEYSSSSSLAGKSDGKARSQARTPSGPSSRSLLIVAGLVFCVARQAHAVTSCEVSFGVESTTFRALQYDVSYDPDVLPASGAGGLADCTAVSPNAVAAGYDHHSELKLSIAMASLETLAAGDVVRCTFDSSVGTVTTAAFSVTVRDQFGAGDPGDGSGVCGAPSTGAQPPFARDALTTYLAVVGQSDCRLCECDTNAGGNLQFPDGTAILRAAVGDPTVALMCGAGCAPLQAGVLPTPTASVQVTSVVCDTDSTTTTTASSTTTTTVPAPLCGDTNDNGTIAAGDALTVLKTAVGTAECVLCVCDANGSGGVTSSDALLVLKVAVGQPLELHCPLCF